MSQNEERARLAEIILNNITAGNVNDVPCGLYDEKEEEESSDSSSN